MRFIGSVFAIGVIALTAADAQIRPLLPEPALPILRVAVVNTPDVLLNELLPEFTRKTGYAIRLQVTEGVYDLARQGMADLVIAHYGHAGTEAFMTEGLGQWPRMVFANQAALIGPSTDPVGIGNTNDAVEAFRRIVERGGEFIVNNAPTERYLAEVLWEAIGRPDKEGWFVDLGLRDQQAIEMASRRGAHTLWGLVPFVRLRDQRPLGMEALVVNDPLFQRVMVSIVVNPERAPRVHFEAALELQRFLLAPATQARMRQFRHHGLGAQTWWPAGRNNAGTELAGF
jgi:tungstate transport system substrate-binding protein